MMGEQVERESKVMKRFWFQKIYTNDSQIQHEANQGQVWLNLLLFYRDKTLIVGSKIQETWSLKEKKTERN